MPPNIGTPLTEEFLVASFCRTSRCSASTPSSTPTNSTAIQAAGRPYPGYAISQHLCKRIEEPFGWIKSAAGLRKTRHRGLARVGWMVTLTAAACNLVRLPKLLANGA